MLSDHERRTLAEIEADLGASDPGFVQSFATSEPSGASPQRCSYLLWIICTSVAVLILLLLASGLPGGVFLCAAVVLLALTSHLSGGYGYF